MASSDRVLEVGAAIPHNERRIVTFDRGYFQGREHKREIVPVSLDTCFMEGDADSIRPRLGTLRLGAIPG